MVNKDDVFAINYSIAKLLNEYVKKQEEAREISNVKIPTTVTRIRQIFHGKELTKHVITKAKDIC